MKENSTGERAVHLRCVGVTIQNGVDAAVRGCESQEEEGKEEGEKTLEESLW